MEVLIGEERAIVALNATSFSLKQCQPFFGFVGEGGFISAHVAIERNVPGVGDERPLKGRDGLNDFIESWKFPEDLLEPAHVFRDLPKPFLNHLRGAVSC